MRRMPVAALPAERQARVRPLTARLVASIMADDLSGVKVSDVWGKRSIDEEERKKVKVSQGGERGVFVSGRSDEMPSMSVCTHCREIYTPLNFIKQVITNAK